MIISKEQQDIVDQNTGDPSKKLIISYVNKNHQISFLQYNVPSSEMFSWKYTTRQYADPIWKSYDNKWIRRVPSKKLNDFRINEILNSFGSQVDPVFEMNAPETWFCDIETDVNESGFPDAQTARNPINTIAITHFPKTIVFGRKHLDEKNIKNIQEKLDKYADITKGYEFEYREFQDEYTMLEDFVKFITPIPAITGWNFLGYDWIYIYNRCNMLGIPIVMCSPTQQFELFKTVLHNGGKIDVMIPLHKIVYDYMLVYQKWDYSVPIKENYSLDWNAEQILGIKKVQHNMGFQEFYRDYYEDYVFYNAVDTILVEQIDKKLHTANIWYMMSSILKIPLNITFSTVKPVETVMSNFIYKDRKVIVQKEKVEDVEASYTGAFVWPTIPGVYKYIGGLDYASLYPTTIRQFLMSCENFMFKDQKGDYKPKEDEIKTKSGAVFKKDRNALLPSILTYYFAQRKFAKKQKKQANQDYEDLKHILEERLKNGES